MNISKLFRRFWAYCFDFLIVLSIYWIILFLIKALCGYNGITSSLEELHRILSAEILTNVLKGQAFNIIILYLIYGLVYLIYETSFLSSKLSATPGKLILGLEVVCYNKSNFQKIIIRSLLKITAILIPPFTILLFILSAFSKTKQSLYDKLSNTCVVTKDNSKKYGTNPEMTLEEFFEEMKSRGLRMYSEQRALSQEIYGRPTPLAKPYYKPAPNHLLFGVFILLISIVVSISFAYYFFPDIQKLYVFF
ncbi:RDD family protein [Acetivibrio clariflavus]|uniref:RDD domain-containing protein n=1 Tax=Acetivibrio clariflavus (strain DSM 19732 / NBRC 101661 / EBR45) TaxID=720554 RepID=G8LUE6_ACECE|nr:RDD family protein [Acetivibrio clariflavus]AEV70594.1 hypothetical protein Clocl_4163 [Acetivibrio clariflavus DSM 19732]HOQ00399.1 RDD family protein [Acetivibrio clariflavus]